MTKVMDKINSRPAPRCKCHGESQQWKKDKTCRAGGLWRCAVKNREDARRWAAENPEKRRAQNLMLHHLTLERYEAILKDQGYKCAGCGISAEDYSYPRFEVDHDHKCCPGKRSCGDCIRGLLCHSCNRALGFLGDDMNRLLGIVSYLSKARV